MGRVFLVLLVLAVATIVHPPLRATAKPYAEAAANPALRWYATWRIDEITRLMEAEKANGRPLPTQKNFVSFVERAFYSESAGRDPWGTPYYLKVETFRIRAVSAGPDRKVGTEDDIIGKSIAATRNR